jgi:hypothetical protein
VTYVLSSGFRRSTIHSAWRADVARWRQSGHGVANGKPEARPKRLIQRRIDGQSWRVSRFREIFGFFQEMTPGRQE